MKPKTGLIIDPFSDRKPSENEERFGQWAAERGMMLLLGPQENGLPTVELGIEEFVGGSKWVAFFVTLYSIKGWPEVWQHYEKLVRAGLEREIEEHCAFAWWEHVSR